MTGSFLKVFMPNLPNICFSSYWRKWPSWCFRPSAQKIWTRKISLSYFLLLFLREDIMIDKFNYDPLLVLDTYHKVGWGSILALDILNKSFYHFQPSSRSNFLPCLRGALHQKYIYRLRILRTTVDLCLSIIYFHIQVCLNVLYEV